jgi:hypothetical protein
MENETELDIDANATRVIRALERDNWEAARALLEQQRRGQPAVVQEALDRFVAAGASTQLARMRDAGSSVADPVLGRVLNASSPPRFPGAEEMHALPSDAQRYDVYASIVAVRGGKAALDALDRSERVILGLRQENSTLASLDDPRTRLDESTRQSGKGVYDDRILVLWKDVSGGRHVKPFDHANTEPTAQYDHHAGSDGRRRFADGGTEARRIEPLAAFAEVALRRKIEGEDVDSDGMRDLGRLAEGTIEMQATTHPNPGTHVREFSLRPTSAAVSAGANRVERDSNADGWFTDADVGRFRNLDSSFKIHRGSMYSTDSAGCQTIRGDEYTDFVDTVRGDPHQTRWQYVLTSTTPGMFRNVTHDAPAAPGARADGAPAQGGERHFPRREGRGGPARPGDAAAPGHPDPRDPRHPDHAAYRHTHALLREAGARHGVAFDEAGLQRATLGLMAEARRDPTVRRIDEVAFSRATDTHQAAHFVAASHRPYGEREPAFTVRVEMQALLQRPVEEALRQLGGADRQVREQGLAVEPAVQRQREALVRTI